MPKADRYTIASLQKGLRILALFSERRPVLRLAEIAALAGVPLPTAFRLVATLEGDGYLERLPDGGLRPGLAVLTLGFAALRGLGLVQVAGPVLRELFARVGHTVNLGVLGGEGVLYVVRLQSDAALVTANVGVGSTLPAVVTSIGKVLLAALDDAELAARLRAERFEGPWGPRAVRSAAALRRQLARVRSDGYAIQDEEVAAGLRSIAAPVRGAEGAVVAAVNVAVPAGALSVAQLERTIRPRLLDACSEISRRLGAPLEPAGAPPGRAKARSSR